MATHIYREQIARPMENRAVVREEYVSESSSSWTAKRVLYYLLNILESLLAIRFVLHLFSANPASPFVNFMYNLTAPFVAPFRGIFPTPTSNGYTLEWATLVAMVIYALLVYSIVELIRIVQED